MTVQESSFLEHILSPKAVREQAQKIYGLALSGETNFKVHEDRIADVSDFVLSVMRNNYPDLKVPYHSRWRHFQVDGSNLLDQYNDYVSEFAAFDRGRVGIDMIVPSVLVDAGAGPKWSYTEPGTSVEIGRSEGLALASLDMFMSGALSGSGVRADCDADGLLAVNAQQFAEIFQHSDENPLLAIEGRVALLNNLGRLLKDVEKFPSGRLSDLIYQWFPKGTLEVSALTLLESVIHELGSIWPGRLTHEGVNLGDTWSYPPLGKGNSALVPFHKLSQWLTYSIIETLENSGFTVQDMDLLTGLAEYRNGGLLLDFGVIELRDPSLSERAHEPASELIVEWRALTVILLDKIGEKVRDTLGMSVDEFPLARVLEGGTWAAGRVLAAERRADGSPPLRIISDGTVF